MNSIEIHINNIGNNINILIDVTNNKIIINGQAKNITLEQINELLRIIRTWKSVYNNKTKVIDTETFNIIINTEEGIDMIKGEGEYPDNYYELKKWIGEFYE